MFRKYRRLAPALVLATAFVAACTLAVVPASASASGYNTVPCWTWNDSGSFAALKFQPRRCTLGGEFGYQQVDLGKMRWRSWRGSSAYGRGIALGNMGVRARVRVKLFSPRRWEENTYRFTRAQFYFAGRGWGPPLVLRMF